MAATSNKTLTHLLVLDFEASCGEGIGASKGNQEIIEWPTLVYNLKTDELEDTFHEYIKPVVIPNLTDFCTQLTGIEQSTVDAADSFKPVFNRFWDFLKKHALDPASTSDTSFAFLTCGEWDLMTMLPAQVAISLPSTNYAEALAPFHQNINIKKAFAKHYNCARPSGMPAMLNMLKLKIEGRHHSGIDDCRNILRIVQRMRKDGWIPEG